MIHNISRYLLTLALLLTAVTGAWAQTVTVTWTLTDLQANSGVTTFTKDGVTITCDTRMTGGKSFVGPVTISTTLGNFTKIEITGSNGAPTTADGFTNDGNVSTWTGNAASISSPASIVNATQFVFTIAPAEPAIEVTTNAAEEGATFTEATFAMPAFDATADYELVRDMGYKVAFSGVPTRARLAKDGNGKFHFADGLTFQLLDNIDAANPKDITSAEGITFMVGEVEAVDFEGNTFYQINKETLVPLADFLADAHLGNYAICAVASTGEYDGSFSSGMITLFQGYEVTIPAGEYITYYRDEPLKLDDADKESIELYTVSSVTATEAVLSDPFDAAPANTPLLVYNKNTEEAKTILLIPCNEPDLALTVADAFKGTLDAKEFSKDDMEAAVYYVCTGKAFAPVKSAGTIAANRCWLEISTAAPSNARKIVHGDATKITNTDRTDLTDGDLYDLNGRKVLNPTKKGIYIKNGRKVVVK